MSGNMGIISVITLLFLPCLPAWAHMQMSSPFPIKSPLDPEVSYEVADYSYTNPLHPDGSDFPCKGYNNAQEYPPTQVPYGSKATWQAGGTYNMTVSGIANHDGGSCQLSLSYDNGESFKVIKSMIGCCPVTTTYDFTIPAYAPAASNVLFAWSWNNANGNREFYMNCARVTIQSATSPGRHRRTYHGRQGSMDDLPDMFTCNVGDGCTTIAGANVKYPDAGANVEYGTISISSPPGSGFTIAPGSTGAAMTTTRTSSNTSSLGLAPCAITSISSNTNITASSTLTGIYFHSTTTPTVTTPSTSSPATSAPSFPISSIIPPPSSPPSSTVVPSSTTPFPSVSTPSSPTSSPPALPGPCQVGSFGCNSPTAFSQCVQDADGSTSYEFMGSVAQGMQCAGGEIIRINSGPCTPNGSLHCDSTGFTFYLCDEGGLIDMGPVALGTECVDGTIGYAPGYGGTKT